MSTEQCGIKEDVLLKCGNRYLADRTQKLKSIETVSIGARYGKKWRLNEVSQLLDVAKRALAACVINRE